MGFQKIYSWKNHAHKKLILIIVRPRKISYNSVIEDNYIEGVLCIGFYVLSKVFWARGKKAEALRFY